MAQMGMDVEAVESVGRQLKQSADSVDQIVSSLDKSVNGLLQVWDGPGAQRFVQQTWPTFRKSMVAAQASIAGLGPSALNNASEQREASGAIGSGSPGSSATGSPLTTQEINDLIERIKKTGGNSLTAVDVGRLIVSLLKTTDGASEFAEVLPRLGKVLGPIGLVLGASDIGEEFAKGEYLKGLVDLLPEVAGTADWTAGMLGATGALASLGPLALGVTVFAGFVDATIPVTAEQQGDTYAMGVRHEFGPGVDPDHLTAEQATAMSERYSSPLGVAMMISDQMDSTANKIFPWNWGKH
jgi:uncharacterized protein YukE